MSVAFRQDVFGGSSVVFVEAAFGADLTASPGTWAWTDVTADVMYGSALNGTWGRADETSQSTPAGMTFSLLNLSGAYSAYAAGIGFNSKATPIRVRRNLGAGAVVEFQGRSVGFTPTWDVTGKLPIVKVVAAGRMRQLGQPKVPARSALRRSISATTGLVAYWPLEDGSEATFGSSAVSGSPAMALTGAVNFGSDGPAGSAPLPDFSGSGTLAGTVQGATSGSWCVSFVLRIDNPAPPDYLGIMRLQSGGLVIDFNWVNAGVGFTQFGFDVIGGGDVLSTTLGLGGDWHLVQFCATQSGGNVTFSCYIDGVSVGGVLGITGATLGTITSVKLPTRLRVNGGLVDSTECHVGHVAVTSPSTLTPPAPTVIADAMTGYAGEFADDRLARICTEDGIPFTLTGTSNITMGPQPIDTPLAILRDAEKSDGGVLFDGFSDGLGYITRSARYNMAASLTIDAGAGAQLAPPFEPVDDDQRTVNQFAASRDGGATVTLSDTTSPLSVSQIGIYPGSDSFNLDDDSFLQGIAGWRINLGTVNGLRYPTLELNFISAGGSTLAAGWMTAVASSRPISFRVDVTNVSTSAINHPAGTLLLIVEGYTVVSDTKSWTVVANCVAYSPNRGLTLNSATQGRIDAANTTTNATLTTTQTGSCSMTVGTFPWATTAAFPADFPMDLNINGEQVTVSAIAAPSGATQAFTISARSVNGVVIAHSVGEKVTVWQPGKVLL